MGIFSQGGATVATDLASDPIELLLNRATCFRLGATKMTGLRGNLAIPRVTSAPTVQLLPEPGTATKSDPTFDQILLTPHKATVTCDLSRQFLLQSSLAAEEFIKNLFADMMAIKTDSNSFITARALKARAAWRHTNSWDRQRCFWWAGQLRQHGSV